MSLANPSTALATVVIDELARNGVELVAISPGSRSGALAVAASRHPGLQTRVVIDERSAAFHALGRAKATGRPAAAIATSGTAPANYLPAVVEADMSLAPLVVISADRPEELRGVGANQTIDQIGLFGRKVRSAIVIDAPGSDEDLNDTWRAAVSTALVAAKGGGGAPGPAHLNVAFREPTVPVSDDGRTRVDPYPFGVEGKPGGAPWVPGGLAEPPAPDFGLPATSRGLVIAGEASYDVSLVLQLAAAVDWPVLATALSGARAGDAITTYHHLLSRGVPEALRPDVVVAIGAIGPSSRLEDLVASASSRFRVDPGGRTIDPRRNATRIAHTDPVALLETIEATVSKGFREAWQAADRQARSSLDGYLASEPVMSGASSARALSETGWEILVAASSLPIREVDAHVTKPGPVIGNRGASGIDGFVSTSLGASSTGRPTVSLSGDLSLLHDSNGFLCEPGGDLVIVVLDNDGGALFDSLPQASHAPDFERLFVTPHGRELGAVAELHSLGYAEAGTSSALRSQIDERLGRGGVHILRVEIDRSHDLAVRRALDELGAGAAGSDEP